MSLRERWTVYPLLFLAVAMGIKTRVVGIENAPTIGCQSLIINDQKGDPVVRIHATPHNQGQIEIFSPDGKLLLAAGGSRDGKAGQLAILDDQGKAQVELRSDGQAGLVQTFGSDNKPEMVLHSSKRGGNLIAWRNDHKMLMLLGHDDADSGIFAIDPATGSRAVVPFATLSRMAPPEQKGEEQGQPEKKAEPAEQGELPAEQGGSKSEATGEESEETGDKSKEAKDDEKAEPATP